MKRMRFISILSPWISKKYVKGKRIHDEFPNKICALIAAHNGTVQLSSPKGRSSIAAQMTLIKPILSDKEVKSKLVNSYTAK